MFGVRYAVSVVVITKGLNLAKCRYEDCALLLKIRDGLFWWLETNISRVSEKARPVYLGRARGVNMSRCQRAQNGQRMEVVNLVSVALSENSQRTGNHVLSFVLSFFVCVCEREKYERGRDRKKE